MVDRAEIRSAVITDIPYLYQICLQTGLNGKDATSYYDNPYLLGQFYAAPYVVYSPDYSFVVENKQTRIPEGYILGTDNTYLFNNWRAKKWLPGIESQCSVTSNNKSEYESSLKKLIIDSIDSSASEEDKELYKEYPAHFHIDILPSLQGCGCGHDLVMTLLIKLMNRGVRGVHLGVDRSNERACRFYEKEGFVIVQEKSWGFIMGKKICRP